jgi:glucose-1-phosphate thymidylyltransferase
VNLVGVVPAAGRAERLGRLPWSKEVLPVAVGTVGVSRFDTPAALLLRQLALAGVGRAFVVLDEDKWDIARCLGDGRDLGLDLAYLTISRSPSTPATVDRAFAHVREGTVAFGFPDILLRPDDTFSRLLVQLEATRADVVLGLFPTDRPEQVDMVELDESGRVRRIVVKPDQTELELAWLTAIWTPKFTAYLHAFMAGRSAPRSGRELYVGDVLQAAADDGLHVHGAEFPDAGFRDVGTPDNLLRALREPW